MQVFIETFGCQMNEYDSHIVKTLLKENHYQITDQVKDADIILLNTCAVRENAFNKVYGRVQRFNHLRAEKRNLIIGILGCMAQNIGEKLLEKKMGVDLIAGPDSYRTLAQKIESLTHHTTGKRQEIDIGQNKAEAYTDIFPEQAVGVNAFISIMRGCNNFCSFCIVPHTRGRERSRSPENIISESEFLISKGYPQVTLLGQNVNSYAHGEIEFPQLLEMVAQIPGLVRIRFTSPHPKDLSEQVLEVMQRYSNICPHIHLPIQSGSNNILGKMNRGYTREEYLQLVDTIKEKLPEITLTTDIIAGFPSESENDFFQTLDILERVRYQSAYIFKYSERDGTHASKHYPDDIPDHEKGRRVTHLVQVQREITLEHARRTIGKTIEVMVEGPSPKRTDKTRGRAPNNQVVVFDNSSKPGSDPTVGSLVNVTINEVTASTLYGISKTS